MPYLPPARLDDFARSANADQLAAEWHRRVNKEVGRYRALPRFLDPLDASDAADREAISWTGFPRIYDSWLSIDEATDPAERARRRDRAHRSAEMLNVYSYYKLQNDGEFYTIPGDPMGPFMLYPEVNGQPSFQDGLLLAERPQDEYLEWFVVRDPATNRIVRIDFTAEAPEYWETLAEGDPQLAADIYSELLHTTVPKEDLFFKGDLYCPEIEENNGSYQLVGYTKLFPGEEDFSGGNYNRHNKWNTQHGAVHLTQANNTLFAEINLAALATKRFAVRPDLGANVDRFELIACGGYGGINRNSDPTIGQAVNTLALSDLKVMVSNPIGLYIGEIDVSGFRDPQNQQVPKDEILTISRGKTVDQDEDGLSRILRFSIHPPEGADYGLESCTFDGAPLSTGGPVARKTTVVIHGIAMPSDGSSQPITSCRGKSCPHVSKAPKYYLVTPPNAPCPPADSERWSVQPVDLAPEILAENGNFLPRSMGARNNP